VRKKYCYIINNKIRLIFDRSCASAIELSTVKDDFAFLWEHAIFRYSLNENPYTDHSEILRFDYVGETTKLAKIVARGWLGAAPQIGEI
jgi:hypothetical protein